MSRSFAHFTGRWSEIDTLPPRPGWATFDSVISAWVKSPAMLGNRYAGHKATTIDEVVSKYFDCRFPLVYFHFPPSPYAYSFFWWDTATGKVGILSNLSTKRVEIDFPLRARRVLSVDDAKAAATDAITVTSPMLPLVFLNDIRDAYEYSNTVFDPRMWELAEVEDTVRRLFSSCRLQEISKNEYFQGIYDSAYFPLDSFTSFQAEVKPPTATGTPESGYVVSLYTWSPDYGGALASWDVELGRNGHVSIKYRVIARELGYFFMSL